jgi:hypothetical protein
MIGRKITDVITSTASAVGTFGVLLYERGDYGKVRPNQQCYQTRKKERRCDSW